ncbi:hypothetical protein H312_00517 [Anncaliia algerae PRA339]|uniref:ISXO2-like transposase domain-containing protein n=1 Tax=Anncaliia algerae PRA339 TaxID=1288291 RepID=A0A059F4C2_9MICR|nr:hypothetical protein H312_00517 [Anncaliia algerae PRA339]
MDNNEKLDAVAGLEVIKNIFDPIFVNNTASIEFLCKRGYLKSSILCYNCDHPALLKKSLDDLNNYFYKCNKKNCRRKISIFSLLNYRVPKLKICYILRSCWFFTCNISNYFAFPNSCMSEQTYIKVRKIYVEACKNVVLTNRKKLGGENKCLQIDETAFKKGKIITNPSSISDGDPNIIWLLGVVEEDKGNIFLEFIKDRTKNTISNFIYENILPLSTIKTDGFASYPKAIEENKMKHIIVNHNKGFRNALGHTTNTIEGLWSLLKYDIKKRKGINRDILENYIFEFMWKYKYVKSNNNLSWNSGFLLLLKELFK